MWEAVMINTTAESSWTERVEPREASIMTARTHICKPETILGDLPDGESIEDIADSVNELQAKLANMKKMMEAHKGSTLGDLSSHKRRETSNIIDTNFLSWVFASALFVILSVSFYAFYSLYHAVLKKFSSRHTEL